MFVWICLYSFHEFHHVFKSDGIFLFFTTRSLNVKYNYVLQFYRLFKVLTETCLRCIWYVIVCVFLHSVSTTKNIYVTEWARSMYDKYEESKEKTDCTRHWDMLLWGNGEIGYNATMQICPIQRNSQKNGS